MNDLTVNKRLLNYYTIILYSNTYFFENSFGLIADMTNINIPEIYVSYLLRANYSQNIEHNLLKYNIL